MSLQDTFDPLDDRFSISPWLTGELLLGPAGWTFWLVVAGAVPAAVVAAITLSVGLVCCAVRHRQHSYWCVTSAEDIVARNDPYRFLDDK
jgi:hypothetical protein